MRVLIRLFRVLRMLLAVLVMLLTVLRMLFRLLRMRLTVLVMLLTVLRMLFRVLRMLLAVLIMLLTVLVMLLMVLVMRLRVLVMLLASGVGNALREASSSAVALRSLLLVHVGVCLQVACHTISSFKPHGANFEFSRSRLLRTKFSCHTVRRWNGLKLAAG
jgi:hypothetical protein